ncbi:alkylated DNA repair protein alkB homolog 8 isoform X2 [Scaptodrosophila lebanonensis]|uniref:Alkylated DNA repair protein alkB homolog 8 isoform X2 n=1 Tax=Drosophila lebanonensis TaxID=7225 RepID=A0A6J2U446_DROLE|nr:alkylated DNA repair protein alkB homolog 8 isoform X2 [Scaptodrosophila lebanonensis]
MRLNLTAVSSPSPIHCQLEKMIATHVSKPKKVDKKKRRCLAIIKADYNVTESETPTIFLAILNAGLCNGLTEETLLAKATAHGKVSQVLMLASKSYCFLKCASIADAESIFLAMHNVSTIGQHGAVCYLSYVTGIPQLEAVENDWNKPLPKGLILLTDFITEEEESALLKAIGNDSRSNEGNMKNRRVKHFGYEFVYGSNNVDSTKPLECRIPTACDFLWPRFRQAAAENDLQGLDWTQPDQLTVNEYEPGHGIPPHVDTHSAFLDPILSLSLESDVVMEFRRGSECTPLLLLRRSLLVMSGEARFDWMHGIRPRHLDWLPTATVSLTMEPRRKRTSLTFRRLRRGPCHCQFPTLCDTHQSTAPKLLMDTLAKQARYTSYTLAKSFRLFTQL